MPLVSTRGAASAQGFGEFAQATGSANYIEDVFSTYLYTGTNATRIINNGVALGDTVTLVGKTITNLGGSFLSAYPITNINDGILETANGQNIGYVPSGSGYFDVYVDLGSAIVVTAYQIAPQGTINSATYNTPTAFTVKASNDAVTWTTITSFTSISTDYPNWNAGTFRVFSFANTTAYRYWRLENTTFGSGSGGVSISDWSVTASQSGAGKGGLVWIKNRSVQNSGNTRSNWLFDSARTSGYGLNSNNTNAESSSFSGLIQFSTNGFLIDTGDANLNGTGSVEYTYASWAFQEQSKFFDIVTYTGNGSAGRTVSHNLGAVPGCIIVKSLTTAGYQWAVYHRSIGNTGAIFLDSTSATSTSASYWNNTTPTSTNFTVGNSAYTNATGEPYVAYLFAHDAGGFGLTGSDNVISCGVFTVDGTGSATVNLGYEPQWIMAKGLTSGKNWWIFDTTRNMSYSTTAGLNPNTTSVETNFGLGIIIPTATGFKTVSYDSSGESWIYIAIRRGPMKVPTSSTTVFKPVTQTGTGASTTVNYGFRVDSWIVSDTNNSSSLINYKQAWFDRLLGNQQGFETADTALWGGGWGDTYFNFQSNTAINLTGDTAYLNKSGTPYVYYGFVRAPKFYDQVWYTGTNSNTTQAHNLGVAPELMIVKRMTGAASGWYTYSSALLNTEYLQINDSNSKITDTTVWNSTSPTSTVFSIGTSIGVNASGSNYSAYLFATVTGVSKVGSYTGTGTTLQINCGFTNGSRFVLIKRTDSSGDWYVWDSARGIVAGNDPYLLLNSQAADVNNTDYVDTYSAGFEISSTAPAAINANGGTFIFLAIA